MDDRVAQFLVQRPAFEPFLRDLCDINFELFKQNKKVTLETYYAWLAGGVLAVESEEAYAHLRSNIATWATSDGNSAAVVLHCPRKSLVDQAPSPPFVAFGYDTGANCALAVKVETDLGVFIRKLAAHWRAWQHSVDMPAIAGVYMSPPGAPDLFAIATVFHGGGGDLTQATHRMLSAHNWDVEALCSEIAPPPPIGADVLAMQLAAMERTARLHRAGVVHNDIKPQNFTCGVFGNKEDVNIIYPPSAYAVDDRGRFTAPARVVRPTVGRADPGQLCKDEGGKHNAEDVFGHGMMLYSECLGGRVGAEAANQRFRFDSVFKLWMLERYLQSGRPMCNKFTAALGFQPVLVHLLASLTCIMTSSGEHRPSLDWCCEYMRRIHLAAVLKQQGRWLEYFQLLAETFTFAWGAAPALYGGGEVYPARQLEDASQQAHLKAMGAVIKRYQLWASMEPDPHSVKLKAFAELKPMPILDSDEARLSMFKVVAGHNSMPATTHEATWQMYRASDLTILSDYTNCPTAALQAVADKWECAPAEIIMRIEVGYQPWAPSKLLSAAMEAERLLAEQMALQAAPRPAAAPEAGKAAEGANPEMEVDAVDLCSDEEMVVDDAEGGDAAEQPEARLPLARHNQQASAAPGMLQHRAAGDGKEGVPAGQQQQPAKPTQSGLIVRTISGSWRMSVNRPVTGPGVHLYTTVPFGEFNDNRRRTRLEQELPKGYSKRGSECDSLRRVTFLYSNRDNPAFTDTEQQCVAVVLEDGLLACLRRAARQWKDSSPLYISLPLACAVPEAERSGAPELDPAHFPVIFKFKLKPRSQLTWQQAAEAQDLWTGTRPSILAKLASRPVFDSSLLREWLVQAAFAAPAPGLNWRQHNALGASGWHTAVKRVLASTESLLRLPVRCSRQYAVGGGYVAADWEELPATQQ